MVRPETQRCALCDVPLVGVPIRAQWCLACAADGHDAITGSELPPDFVLRAITKHLRPGDEGSPHRDWELRFMGLPLPDRRTDDKTPVDYPRFQYGEYDTRLPSGTLVSFRREMQVWVALGRWADSPLWVDLRWRPGLQWATRLCGIEWRHSPNDLPRAEKIVAFFDEAIVPSRRGRPIGTGEFENPAQFQEVVGAAVRALRQRGKNPTAASVQRQLWSRIQMDKSNFTKLYQRFGWRTWGDFLRSVE